MSDSVRPSLSDTIIPRLVTPFKNFYEKWSHEEEKHIYVFFYKLLTELICYGGTVVVKMVYIFEINILCSKKFSDIALVEIC